MCVAGVGGELRGRFRAGWVLEGASRIGSIPKYIVSIQMGFI